MPSFWTTDNMFVYNDVVDAAGNVVVKANRNGKYPNLRWNQSVSTCWQKHGKYGVDWYYSLIPGWG